LIESSKKYHCGGTLAPSATEYEPELHPVLTTHEPYGYPVVLNKNF